MLDDQMQTASQALAEMDYARCEALCLEALAQAREAEDWVAVRRVLLPLQEARRQRRQKAIDGWITLGQNRDEVDDRSHGCVVFTRPVTTERVASFDAAMRASVLPVEVLYADNNASSEAWRITTFSGPRVTASVPAPRCEWIGQTINAQQTAPPTPAHWFMQASEELGNAALASITEPPGTVEYFDALANALAAVGDHEILHQRLADAAKALHGAGR